MLISRELAKAFNAQIGHEFGASMQYVSIAAHFSQRQSAAAGQTVLRAGRRREAARDEVRPVFAGYEGRAAHPGDSGARRRPSRPPRRRSRPHSAGSRKSPNRSPG